MLHVALFEPEIPPNTGNIIRLCANCGAKLHLIHPLGFSLDTKQLRRAGLDYHEWADIAEYKNFATFLKQAKPKRLFACTSKGNTRYTDINFKPGDTFLFGPESRGLPPQVLKEFSEEEKLTIPMITKGRSINLANAVSIIIFEAWRQQGFMAAV